MQNVYFFAIRAYYQLLVKIKTWYRQVLIPMFDVLKLEKTKM